MKIVKFLIKLLIGLIGILAIAFVIAGLIIPNEKTFTNEIKIDATPETVWNVLNDVEKLPEWQEDISKVEIKDEKNWIEYPKYTDPISFSIVESKPPNKLKLRYQMGEGFKGEWLAELKPASNGATILSITEKSIIKGLIRKVTTAILFDIEESSKQRNQKLKKRAETIKAEKPN